MDGGQTGEIEGQVSVNLYKVIFESVDRGMMIISREGIVIEVNRAWMQILGRAREVVVGKEFEAMADVFVDEGMSVIQRNMGMVRMGQGVQPCEVRVVVGGVERIVEVSAVGLAEKKVPVGDLLLMRDVTTQKRVEEVVQASEQRLRMVLASIREGITLSSETGEFLIYNPEMQEITGYSQAEANGDEDFYLRIHPGSKDKERMMGDLMAMGPGERRSNLVKMTTKSGAVKKVLVSTIVIEDGRRKLFLSVYHDVTERQKAEDELIKRNLELEQITAELNMTTGKLSQARDHLEEKVKEQTEELRKTLDTVENLAKFSSEDPFPVLRVSREGMLLYANDASRSLLEGWGSGVNQAVPKKWGELVGEVYESNNRKIVEIELNNEIISFMVVPVKSGEYVNMYGRDVTREKEVEQVKNEFISLVSHQIRTPLTSMRWYSEMLISGRDKLNLEQVEVARTIHETAVQLAELVNDLLNISRMESGRSQYDPKYGDIARVVEEVIRELAPMAEGKGVVVRFEAHDLETFVFDEQLVRQVYMNLINNAIKYSKERGEVAVRLRSEGMMLVSEVVDYGIGIPEAAKNDIFQRFYRAQNVVDAEIDGTGLGLSVARMMVEKCGGRIWFESKVGTGSKFSFSLPMNLGT